MLAKPIEIDTDTRAAIYQLVDDERPVDNIYGEQPYSDSTGRWIAIRLYQTIEHAGGLEVVDLTDGSRRTILEGPAPFPAFHAWGDYLYWNQTVQGKLMLRRCRLATAKVEDVRPLPADLGSFSYGTVSPDHGYYAVSVQPGKDLPSKVYLLELQSGACRLLLDKPGYHAKHEQFSRNGRNRVLIQLNQMPAVKQVLLGELAVGGENRFFPADQPHTPRPTGHEAWIGDTDRIFFSAAFATERNGVLWTGRVGDMAPQAVAPGKRKFIHVSVSRDGRFWVADCTSEEGVPIYIGRFGGMYRRLVFSRTVMTREQWSHTHPYLTADNRWLIFTSTRGGHPQVYGANLAEGWIERL